MSEHYWTWTSGGHVPHCITHPPHNLNTEFVNVEALCTAHTTQSDSYTVCGNQTTFESLWIWRWRLSLLDPYVGGDMGLYIRTWAEERVKWMALRRTTLLCLWKFWQEQGQLKVVFVVVYGYNGILLCAVSRGMTVNIVYFSEHHLHSALRCKCSYPNDQDLLCLQCRIANIVACLFSRCNWEVLKHLLYLPYMSLCNCSLFWEVKGPLCGVCLRMRNEVMNAVQHAIIDTLRTNAADGGRHLQQFYSVSWDGNETGLKRGFVNLHCCH